MVVRETGLKNAINEGSSHEPEGFHRIPCAKGHGIQDPTSPRRETARIAAEVSSGACGSASSGRLGTPCTLQPRLAHVVWQRGGGEPGSRQVDLRGHRGAPGRGSREAPSQRDNGNWLPVHSL